MDRPKYCGQGIDRLSVQVVLQLEHFRSVEQATVYEFVKVGDERRAHHIDGLWRVSRGEGGVLELPISARQKRNIVEDLLDGGRDGERVQLPFALHRLLMMQSEMANNPVMN